MTTATTTTNPSTTIITCPRWCTTIHRPAPEEAMSTTGFERAHVHTVLHTDTAWGHIIVAVEQMEGGPVYIWGESPDVMTVEEALEMATALTAAAAFAGQVSR